MKYAVEFELQSENRNHVSKVVYEALVAAFGSTDNFRLMSCSTYTGVFRGSQPIVWEEVHPK